MKGRHFMNIRTASVAFVVALPACFGAGAVAQTYGGERQPSSEDSAAGDRGQQRQQMKDQFDREVAVAIAVHETLQQRGCAGRPTPVKQIRAGDSAPARIGTQDLVSRSAAPSPGPARSTPRDAR